jgi:autotransporter-associated beta strand protein
MRQSGRFGISALAGLMAAGFLLVPTALLAVTGTWTNTAAGSYSWNVNGNWDPNTAFPNGQDDVAYLTNNITGNQTVDLGQAITLGRLSIGDADSWSRYIITNTTANALTFQTSSGIALLEKRGVTAHASESDVIAANMTLASDLTVSNLVNMTGNNQMLTLSGNITENGGAKKIKYATVAWQGFVISGSNTYSGGTELSFGGTPAYIEVRNPNALGSGAVTTPSGSSLVAFNLSVPATFSNNMTLNNNSATVLRNMMSNEVTLNGNLAGSGNTFYSVIEGPGTFVLGGNINNSARLYVKNTTVKIAATATFGASCANICLAEGNSNTGKLYLANGATVTKEVGYANSTWDLPLTIATPVYLGMYEAGSATVSGGVQLNGNNRSGNTANSLFYLDVPSAATLTLSGIVKHANTYATNTLVKVGAGTAVLAGANTYGCPTIISSGTLSVSNNAALGTGLLTLAGGTLAASAGTWTIANPVNLAGNSTVDTGANSLTLSGAITNSGALTKTGSGILTLFGTNNTYSGATTVSDGTLKVGFVVGTPVANNSFESPVKSPVNFYEGVTPDSWTLSSGVGITVGNNNIYNSAATIPDGNQAAFTKGTGSRLGQNLVFYNSCSNTISFSAVCRAGNTSPLDVRLDGTVLTNVAPGVGSWTRYTVPCFVTAGTHSLVFSNTATGDKSVCIDNVIVSNDFPYWGALPSNSPITIASGATLDLAGSSQAVTALNGSGVLTNGTLTVTGTLAPGGTGVIGDLTVNANLVLAPNATYDWNFGTATQDTVNVTGTLTLPSSATVNVSRVTGSSAQQPDSAVLMTFTTGPSDGALSGWVITGARGGSQAIVRNNKVMLISSNGTLIRVM